MVFFEVHIYSWEDIVDLIDENKQTHDYYVRSINFKSEQDIKFLFENDEDLLTKTVPFQKTIKNYKLRPTTASIENSNFFGQLAIPKIIRNPMFSFNRSYCQFYLRLHNTGSQPIEEFKIFLSFNGEFESIDTCTKGSYFTPMPDVKYDTFIWNDDKAGKIIPLKNVLVPDDSMGFDTICLKPLKDQESEVKIYWQLISLNYKSEGELTLVIIPNYEEKEEVIYVSNPSEVTKVEEIEDIISE